MKILRLFESKYTTDFFKNSKLDNFLEEEREFKEKKKKMLNLINEYVDLNHDYFSDEYEINSVSDFLVKKPGKEDIQFFHLDDSVALRVYEEHWHRYLSNKDFEKLVKFIDNPDLYRSQKKYNI